MGAVSSAIGSGIGDVGSGISSGWNFLSAPSLLNNPAGLANQMRLVGASGPSNIASGQNTSGMFGMSPLQLGGQFGSLLNQNGGGSPGMRDIGMGLQALSLLSSLAAL